MVFGTAWDGSPHLGALASSPVKWDDWSRRPLDDICISDSLFPKGNDVKCHVTPLPRFWGQFLSRAEEDMDTIPREFWLPLKTLVLVASHIFSSSEFGSPNISLVGQLTSLPHFPNLALTLIFLRNIGLQESYLTFPSLSVSLPSNEDIWQNNFFGSHQQYFPCSFYLWLWSLCRSLICSNKRDMEKETQMGYCLPETQCWDLNTLTGLMVPFVGLKNSTVLISISSELGSSGSVLVSCH